MQVVPVNTGWIEVICGPMFSGKTEELIRRIRRALYAKEKVEIFKPKIDTRYAELDIVSHTSQSIAARPIEDAREILTLLRSDTAVVAVDEAQFFSRNLVNVCQTLADNGKRVVVAGLDQDFMGRPFEPIPELLAIAEFVTKTLAICVVCGNPAGRSQRITPQSRRVMLGATDAYEARCRRCHDVEVAVPEQIDLLDKSA